MEWSGEDEGRQGGMKCRMFLLVVCILLFPPWIKLSFETMGKTGRCYLDREFFSHAMDDEELKLHMSLSQNEQIQIPGFLTY